MSPRSLSPSSSSTQARTHARKHWQSLCTKLGMFSQVKPRLHRSGSANRPWRGARGSRVVTCLGGGRLGPGSSQYEPSTERAPWLKRMPLRSVIMQTVSVRPTSACEIQRIWHVRPRVLPSCGEKKSSADLPPVPPVPLVFPTLSAGKGMRKTGFVTARGAPLCSRLR